MYEWMFVAPPAHKNSRYLGRSNTIHSTIGPPHAWSIPTNATTTTTFSCAAKELCFIWPFQAWFRFQLVSVSGGQSILRWILNGFPPPQSQSKSHLHALTLCGSIKNGQIEKKPTRLCAKPCTLLQFRTSETGMHETFANNGQTEKTFTNIGSCTQGKMRLSEISPTKL